MGRTIVIGDIHGCFDELQDLLRVVELRTDDRVIAVGDLIVKGTQNREVLDRFIEDDRFSSVIGNHDRAVRQYWRGEPLRLSKEQRVTAAELESQRERYSTYLRSLPFTINLGSHLVVHAGMRPGVPLRRQMASDLTEMRTMGANPSSRNGVPWYDVKDRPLWSLAGEDASPGAARHGSGYRLRLRGTLDELHHRIESVCQRTRTSCIRSFRSPLASLKWHGSRP